MNDINVGSFHDLKELSFDREVWRAVANQSRTGIGTFSILSISVFVSVRKKNQFWYLFRFL
jgi:hypothetical protein